MTEDDILQRFKALYQGRTDVYGAVWGECVKAPLTDAVWRSHLFGDGSVGVYPLVPNEGLYGPCSVHWGASDVDLGYEVSTPAWNLQAALSVLGITSFVERSKGKGYHVIAHASDWVPAADMRRTFLVAHQLAGFKATEVYPKQEELTADRPWGNFLNLSYANVFVRDNKRVVLSRDHTPMPLGSYIEAAEASLNEPSVFAEAAKLYTPPPPPKHVVLGAEPTEAAEQLSKKLNGLAHHIFVSAEPLEEPDGRRDRSKMLARLAYECEKSGLTAEETYVVLEDVDARCGKFANRRDRDEQLLKLVSKAFA